VAIFDGQDRFAISFFSLHAKETGIPSGKPAVWNWQGCPEAFILHHVEEANRGHRDLAYAGCIPRFFCRLAEIRDLIYRSWSSAWAGFTQLARTGPVFIDGSATTGFVVPCHKWKKARSKPRFTTLHHSRELFEADFPKAPSGSSRVDARFAYRLAYNGVNYGCCGKKWHRRNENIWYDEYYTIFHL